MKSNGLTPKQDRFCREYLVDINSTKAAVRAGYSEHTANKQGPRLLRHPLVRPRIAELQQAAADRNDVEVDEVVKMLRASYREAKAEKQHGPAVRAAELLGKTMGMFSDKITLTDEQKMTDEELIEKLADGDPEKVALLRKTLLVPDGFRMVSRGATTADNFSLGGLACAPPRS
jgi:phage terminase small subunit